MDLLLKNLEKAMQMEVLTILNWNQQFSTRKHSLNESWLSLTKDESNKVRNKYLLKQSTGMAEDKDLIVGNCSFG